MSAGLQTGEPPSLGSSGGATWSPTARSNVTRDACAQLRFDSLTLDELSEELDRRTKETQRLQEEVENATRLTLARFGCTDDARSSLGKKGHSAFDVYDSPGGCTIHSNQQHQALTPVSVCSPDMLHSGAQKEIKSPDGGVIENKMDVCLQRMSDLQLDRTPHEPEKNAFGVEEAVMTLQTKLHRVQTERDALSDLRLKDSRTHVHQMEEMLAMLQELQNIKRAGDKKLQETEEETTELHRKIEMLEKHVKAIYVSVLCEEDRWGDRDIMNPARSRSAAQIPEDFNDETELQQETPRSAQRCEGSEEHRRKKEQTEQIEDVIRTLGQEMALLTDKLSSSKSSLSVKLDTLQKLTARQASEHRDQIRELQVTVCTRTDQVRSLKLQLQDAQRERGTSPRHVHGLQERLRQLEVLQRSGEQQQGHLQEELKVARGRLVVVSEEKTCLELLLEQSKQQGWKSQEVLQEKSQEAQQLLSRLEEAQGQNQTLRLQLEERETTIDVLRLQIDKEVQTTAQHSRAAADLQQENSLLSNQLNQHKQQIHTLGAELEQKKSELAAAERQRLQLQASVTELHQRVHEESLEKQQLSSLLDTQRSQCLSVTQELQQLQQLHICGTEQHQGAVLQLQVQLRNAQNEAQQVRSTMRTLQEAEGHGIQAAREMQTKITAQREQIDSLRGEIKHLEETVEKLQQEKRRESLEQRRRLQQLPIVREEKKQLQSELEMLRCTDGQLRERIRRLEENLHKMSESFADCQDFLQQQEQEFCRLKLQHVLKLKELKGRHFNARLDPDSPTPPPFSAPPGTQGAPGSPHDSPVRDLRAGSSERLRPHTDHPACSRSSRSSRRRSAPEREHKASPESRVLKTIELNRKSINKKLCDGRVILIPAAAASFALSQQLLSLGRRSPVHSLLTSDPNSQQ